MTKPTPLLNVVVISETVCTTLMYSIGVVKLNFLLSQPARIL